MTNFRLNLPRMIKMKTRVSQNNEFTAMDLEMSLKRGDKVVIEVLGVGEIRIMKPGEEEMIEEAEVQEIVVDLTKEFRPRIKLILKIRENKRAKSLKNLTEMSQ